MSVPVANNVKVQLFVGVLLTHDLRRRLHESPSWKEALIGWQSQPDHWKEFRYKNKEYFGKSLSDSSIPLSELKEMEEKLRDLIKTHSPDSEQLKIVVFTQILVA